MLPHHDSRVNSIPINLVRLICEHSSDEELVSNKRYHRSRSRDVLQGYQFVNRVTDNTVGFQSEMVHSLVVVLEILDQEGGAVFSYS